MTKFQKSIKEKNLLQPDDKVLIAISGVVRIPLFLKASYYLGEAIYEK
ncbi:MAG: hypothetical protein U9R23_04680 [Candidatus Cloacimonadota bacterium]|nr:hypothetical protein [Candidatus Cloacimonadota bacterium]